MLVKHRSRFCSGLNKSESLLQKIDKYCNGVWKPNKMDEFKFLSNSMLKKITGHNKSMNTGKLSEWYVGEILRKKGINYTCQPIVKYNLNNTIPKNKIVTGNCFVQPQTMKITRITRSSVNSHNNIGSCLVQARTQTGSSHFTTPLTRSKARLLQKKNGKVTKDKDISDIKENFTVPVSVRAVGKSSRFIQPDYYLPDYDLFIEVKSRSYNCNGTASEKLDHIVRKYSKLEFTENYKKSKLLIVCSAYELFEESTSELLNYNNTTSRKYIKDFVKLSKKYNILDWIPIHKIHNYF